ncbi:hypothetical protein E2C01_045152 [Portunus trituberculatus]|uniref:Uncharacterized protein n=1 Tax=Portunus trituberculatus TaxID=210409 RepID=A0A5B7G113_PORTR|nr:hypothetical protein [Portunus trituberculatus]
METLGKVGMEGRRGTGWIFLVLNCHRNHESTLEHHYSLYCHRNHGTTTAYIVPGTTGTTTAYIVTGTTGTTTAYIVTGTMKAPWSTTTA